MLCHRCNFFIFIALIAFIVIIALDESAAQSSLNYRWYINANGGVSQVYGDIQSANNPFEKLSEESTFGYGARLGKYISPVFSLHFQFYNSELKGVDPEGDRNSSASLMEYQLGTTVNLSNLFFKNKERTLSIYALAGISEIFFRSELHKISTGELIKDYGYKEDAEGIRDKREFALSFPLGLGLDCKLSDHIFLNLESALRFTNTDRIDAREAGTNNDAYYYTSLGISYNFSSKKAKESVELPIVAIADPFANEQVDLIYDIPRIVKSTDEFVIKSTIHKGKIDGPGRLIQVLPIGLNVLDTAIAGAKTEFINYTLYLNWDELPADSVFEVSYRVKPDKIFGSLPMMSNLYLQKTGKEFKFRTSIFIERVEEPIVVQEPVKEVVKKDTLVPVKLVEYRVQLTVAYKSKIPQETLSKQFNLKTEFKEDCIGNWCYYSVGSLDTYDQAKAYRDYLINEHNATGAFIVAFYNGKRLNKLSELKEIQATPQPVKTVYKEEGYCYRVQILAMLNKSVDPESLRQKHKIEEEVNEEVYTNWRKYTVGKCTTFSEAKALMTKLRAQGLSDTFIVTYKNGERVLTK